LNHTTSGPRNDLLTGGHTVSFRAQAKLDAEVASVAQLKANLTQPVEGASTHLYLALSDALLNIDLTTSIC